VQFALMISLIGLPGGGKSTVGRQLARRIDAQFIDADTVLEARLGMPIRVFFEQYGEEPFRDEEARIIDELTAQSAQPMAVLATGGGVVLREENRSRLRARTAVIYLRSTPEELFRRLRHDTHRPLLQVDDPFAKLRELHAVRHPLYQETAHYTIDTGRPSVSKLVNMIKMQLEMAGILPNSINSDDQTEL
jgi:shikimate kinase